MRAIEGVQRTALAFSAHHGLSTKVKTPLRKGEPLFGYGLACFTTRISNCLTRLPTTLDRTAKLRCARTALNPYPSLNGQSRNPSEFG